MHCVCIHNMIGLYISGSETKIYGIIIYFMNNCTIRHQVNKYIVYNLTKKNIPHASQIQLEISEYEVDIYDVYDVKNI